MALKKTDTRETYMQKYGLGTTEIPKTEARHDTREDYMKKYGFKANATNTMSLETAQKIYRANEENYKRIVDRGKRNQSIFSDNAMIQQQLRQETGPSLYDLMTD